FDSQRERRDVKQENVFDVSLEHTGLNRGTNRHYFIGIDALMALAAKQLPHPLLNRWHPGHPTDQDHFIDIASAQAGILECRCTGPIEALQQIGTERFEFSACEFHIKVFWTGLIGSDKG